MQSCCATSSGLHQRVSLSTDRYARLDAAEIIKTAETLSSRIGERFPNAGLKSVSARLSEIARQASERSEAIARPLLWLRFAALSLSALILISFVATIVVLAPQAGRITFIDFIQSLESGINELVLIGAAILFLVTFEARVKRNRALAAIHELRSLAHIIDMHQLTKDPERIVFKSRRTATSPRSDMTPFELDRYLDYCGEMLALIGKIAALYVQRFEDSQAVAAVNDVEQLTSGLSRKIWQKIMILHTVCGAELAETAGKSDARSGLNRNDGIGFSGDAKTIEGYAGDAYAGDTVL